MPAPRPAARLPRNQTSNSIHTGYTAHTTYTVNSTFTDVLTLGRLAGFISRSCSSLTKSPTTSIRLSEEVTRVATSFTDDKLRRATTVWRVLQSGGHLMASSKGSAETFELSRPVAVIEDFISHNWSLPRWRKFLVLALRYNFNIAMLMGVVAVISCFALQCVGVIDPHGGDGGDDNALVVYPCAIAFYPVFVLTLLAGREVCGPLGLPGRDVFLDKACIHQVDEALKQEGIRSLAAYLAASRSMTLVLGEEYLAKLWTVYELATALILNPEIKLHIVLPFLPHALLKCGLLAWLAVWARNLHHLVPDSAVFDGMEELWEIIAHIPVTAGAFIMHRQCHQQQDRIRQMADDFDIRKALCSVTSDRALVQYNVVHFMRSVGLSGATDGKEEVLEAFNSMVRKEIPQALHSKLRYCALMYTVTMMASMELVYLDEGASELHRYGFDDSRRLASLATRALAYILIWYPLLWGLLLSRFAQLSLGYAPLSYTFAICMFLVAHVLSCAVLQLGLHLLHLSMALFIVCSVAFACVLVCLHSLQQVSMKPTLTSSRTATLEELAGFEEFEENERTSPGYQESCFDEEYEQEDDEEEEPDFGDAVVEAETVLEGEADVEAISNSGSGICTEHSSSSPRTIPSETLPDGGHAVPKETRWRSLRALDHRTPPAWKRRPGRARGAASAPDPEPVDEAPGIEKLAMPGVSVIVQEQLRIACASCSQRRLAEADESHMASKERHIRELQGAAGFVEPMTLGLPRSHWPLSLAFGADD